MNLSHVITEFSFGPYFPDITQPLDNSFELTSERRSFARNLAVVGSPAAAFVAYQYYLHVVPTTYIAPRTKPLSTSQSSVTHYPRVQDHHSEHPGIFFKFDLEPMKLTIHQRTTSFVQLFIRFVSLPCTRPNCTLTSPHRTVGVIGGVFVCMGYAVKITGHAVDAVTGADKTNGIVAAESSGISGNLRKKFGSGDLRLRPSNRVVRQGNSWVVDGGSPYGSYAGTPVSAGFGSPHSNAAP